ncbi:MAG TPA: hydantoinase/oxoprolinase family protein [Acetobacteraceae bacterium]|nr:hydantoinase/oxoprolinase family protein [Acetobacteraceae bacterium]
MTHPAALAVAVDIGGTFTDITLANAGGKLWRAKVPSTPADPSEGFMAGVHAALTAAAATPGAITRVLHGTTVATNLILEGKTARTALVTTAGFRHVMEIGRQDIPRAANLFSWVKPRRPVPPERVMEVIERVGPDGTVLVPLDEASVRDAADALRRLDVQAVAICLLHSFAHPEHERRVAAILRQELPDVAITASVDVLPVVREYERSLASVLNAGVMPAIGRYVARLSGRLAEAGIAAPLLLMQSNGGVAGAAAIGRAPVLTALSGPAAGVVGARDAAAACGIGDIVTVDIGGTSADICLLQAGRIALTQKGHVGAWPLPLPMVDMVTIGAGGGSIGQLSGGALTVGPASAGAVPGPACYGMGGIEPTVTDAHLVLGHLPEGLLGGGMALDRALAEGAISERVARPLGLSLEAAARGILAIADANMVGAIRVVSVERGHDPRDFCLVAFGGAGPLHGTALAELLGITRVLVPPAPGVLCAEGLLAAGLKAEFSRTLAGTADDSAAIEAAFGALERDAAAWLDEEHVPQPDRRIVRVALMRYAGQGGELAVAWPEAHAANAAFGTDLLPAARQAFAEEHRRLNGFVLESPVELVTLRVEAEGLTPPSARHSLAPGAGVAVAGSQQAWFGEGSPVATAIHARASLGAGDRLGGPAIITQLDATTLVPPDWTAAVMPSGALLLCRRG